MPEEYEDVTEHAQELIREHRAEAGGEHAASRSRPAWLDALAVSTALFAVFAAIAALRARDSANEALYRANGAVLQQARAVDVWNEYQDDSVKKYQAKSLATLLTTTGGSAAQIAAANQEAGRRQAAQDRLKPEATRLDAETRRLTLESQELLHRHQRFALSVTLFQVAIGLSAIAALLRLHLLWWTSLLVGAGAVTPLLLDWLGKV